MNEEDLPSLRLSRRYRQMLTAEGTDKEVKEYVKERFRSALQLMRNIAQRKSTILRTCEVIVRRQQDFLEMGIEALRPMMIKEVAEEIGVHPSTVSRAVANKYAHTPQGVIELRFFFSEGSNGPEGADTPLLVLKRKVRKLIEEEDARHPLTDDQLAAMLQAQGIQLTRRTVAKYREDMNIPSTHQRRRTRRARVEASRNSRPERSSFVTRKNGVPFWPPFPFHCFLFPVCRNSPCTCRRKCSRIRSSPAGKSSCENQNRSGG